MRARDVIVTARRRAGITQQELGQRLGVPQVTVARWESGATEPKFESVQQTVKACGLDLTLGFTAADDHSWAPLIYEQLAREPQERVEHLTRDNFDRIAALQLVATVGARAIAIGETAGAMHGWPLILSDHGTLDLVVHPDDRQLAEETILPAALNPGRIRLLDRTPGTHGFADLARNVVQIPIGRASVEVAGLVDLLRIALTERGPYSQRFALALDATLQLTARSGHPEAAPITSRQARERADQWLATQAAA